MLLRVPASTGRAAAVAVTYVPPATPGAARLADRAGNAAAGFTRSAVRSEGAGSFVRGVDVVSTPAAGGVYGAGERIEIQVTFDGLVTVGADVFLTLAVGTARRRASVDPNQGDTDDAGNSRVPLSYEVRGADFDGDGFEVLELGGVSEDGIPVDVSFAVVHAGTGHRVDGGGVPFIRGAPRLLSRPAADGIYQAGSASSWS